MSLLVKLEPEALADADAGADPAAFSLKPLQGESAIVSVRMLLANIANKINASTVRPLNCMTSSTTFVLNQLSSSGLVYDKPYTFYN
ncbi:hypothetical protein D3C73_805860 [compost metagenome]